MSEPTPSHEVTPSKRLDKVVTEKSGLLSTDDTVKEAGDKMRSMGAETLPVSDGQHLVGVVHDRNPDRSAAGHGHDPNAVLVSESMSRDPVFCYADQNCTEALQLMRERGLEHLPVVDRELRVIGLLSRAEIEANERSSGRLSAEGEATQEGQP